MNVASTFRRIVAHTSDEIIGSLFWLPLAVSAWSQMGQGQSIVIPWTLILAAWFGRMTYEILCIYVLQALPAQRFFGLKIVSTYHPEVGLSLGQVALRVLFAQFKYVLGPSIFFMALFHRDRQHLGDILAETRVVQFQERDFPPKARFILGSFLVFFSLVGSLSESARAIAANRFQQEGMIVEIPKWGAGLDPRIQTL